MKEILKGGGKLFLKIAVTNFMCIFLVLSFSVISTAAFTENIGYIAYGTVDESAESEELYTYYYKDGDDTKKAEYEEKGYTISTASIRSELSKSGRIFFLVISQIFTFSLLCGFIYPNFWHSGTNDSNLVKFKHKNEDKLIGFKTGAIATIPNYLLLIYLIIAKFAALPSFSLTIYKFLNSSVYSFIEIILGGAFSVSELSLWRFILLFLLPLVIPAIAGVSYILGYKNISIGEKLVYKKK